MNFAHALAQAAKHQRWHRLPSISAGTVSTPRVGVNLVLVKEVRNEAIRLAPLLRAAEQPE